MKKRGLKAAVKGGKNKKPELVAGKEGGQKLVGHNSKAREDVEKELVAYARKAMLEIADINDDLKEKLRSAKDNNGINITAIRSAARYSIMSKEQQQAHEETDSEKRRVRKFCKDLFEYAATN